jgi:hypothetical protein
MRACPYCHDRGWVCEEHPSQPADHDPDRCGGSMPCGRCETGRQIKQQLDALRAAVAAVNMLEPVTLAQPLWTLAKGGHVAEARVRALDGIGLEFRFTIEGITLLAPIHGVGTAGAGGAGEARRL